ncbi:MAG: lipid II flippase MurJ [Deferrisomatales bacterium]
MSGPREMTALQGVAFGTSLNFFCRILNLGRQVLITAYFGLSTGLDSFFAAASIVSILVTSLGDIFDSAGVPALVRVRQHKGRHAFRELTGSVFWFALRLGGAATLLTFLVAPFAHFLFPGLPTEAKLAVRHHVLLLGLYSATYLPYHCLGSFFRSVRHYHLYYVAECVVMGVALLVVIVGQSSVYTVPLSLSAGYLAGLLFLLMRGWRDFDFRPRTPAPEMAVVKHTVRRMVPLYLGGYGMLLLEKCFGSFLASGGISALAYGFILASAVPGIMNIENVFVTALAEETDRGVMATMILSGIWLVSLLVLVFFWGFAPDIVAALFSRGAFTPEDAAQTADALRGYSLAIPAYYITPICLRTMQILGWLEWAVPATLATLAVNLGLGLLFLFGLEMGASGVALAMALAAVFYSALCLMVLHHAGVKVEYRRIARLVPGSLAAAALGLLALRGVPEFGSAAIEIAVKALAFAAVYGLVCLVTPGREFRRIRLAVGESFPCLRWPLGWTRRF